MPAANSLVVLLLLVACDKKSAPHPTPGSGSPVVAPVVVDAAVVALADAGVDAPAVDAAPIPCEAPAIAAVRKEAQAYMKAGKFDAAVTRLEVDTCSLDRDQPPALQKELAWLRSDLSFAYYKAGSYEACYAIAAAETSPYMGNVGSVFDETHPVIGALDYNAKLCEDAAAKERGVFTGGDTCAFAADGYALPASLLDPTDKAACLVIEKARMEDDMHVCGDVALVRRSKQGKLSRTKLEVGEDGNLSNGGVCCNIERVSFGRRGANLAILVATMGRNCDGGTAASEEQHAYEVKGATLELYHSLDAVAH